MNMCCLYCTRPLKGRSSKKFCGNSCRSAWHYRQKADRANPVNMVNEQLLQNRRILNRLMPPDAAYSIAGRNELLHQGFQFQFHTESHFDDRGLCFHFCYEFCYAPLDEHRFQLIRLPPGRVPGYC